MKLTDEEKRILISILKTEIMETKDLVEMESDKPTKQELKEYLENVKVILKKFEEEK